MPLHALLRTGSTLLTWLAGLVVAFRPVQTALLRALESRFPAWSDAGRTPPIGIIVLGGGLHSYLVAQRDCGGLVQGAGERVATALALANQFPDATVTITGEGRAVDEPDLTSPLTWGGVDPRRVLIETRSRNTAENAALAFQLLQPQPGQKWILVTSAYHMPRAMGCFRAVGFEVEACPVEYLQSEDPHRSAIAWKEVVGLLGYRLLGRTATLFPAP